MSFHSHPKWKYAVGQAVIVQNEEEEAALEGEWFDLPEQLEKHLEEKARKIDEALRLKREKKADDDDLDKKIADLKKDLGGEDEQLPDIETLRATAADLGIEVHPRTGAKKLSEQIKAAIEAKGE
jgi:hypothetical protein